MKPDPYLAPYMKMNSQQIKDINVRPKTKQKKLLEESIRQTFHYIGFGNDSLDMTPKAQVIKERNRQIRFHEDFKKFVKQHYQ